MKIAVGAMMHETNTFTFGHTDIRDFTCASGREIFNMRAWGRNAVGGMLDELKKGDAEIAPAFFAYALPGGIVKREAFDYIKSKILNEMISAGKIDGVLLALHGSMYTDNEDDPEGALLQELRQIVGYDIPIVCSLDMHATITERMLENANGFAAYRTAPHIDEYQTGQKAVDLLLTSIVSGKKLKTCMTRLPILIAGEKMETTKSPVKELFALLDEADKANGFLCTSYTLGFPWADSKHSGAAALATGFDDGTDALERVSHRLAKAFDTLKKEFTFTTEAYGLDEAIDIALADNRQPVVISDSGDNPTAGSAQDGSLVVKILAQRNITNVLVAIIADKSACDLCKKAGGGSMVHLDLGRLDPQDQNPTPYHIQAAIQKIASIDNTEFAVVSYRGITIVIADRRIAVTNPEYLQMLGLDVKKYKIMILKSGYLSPQYQALAARCILALTPGDTCEILENLSYHAIPRPIFPLDQI